MENDFNGYWSIKKRKLKLKYPFLSDTDLRFSLGNENEMMDVVGAKIGITNQALLKIIVSI